MNSKIALVTGATAGLGREVACALAGRGMKVLVHGRDEKRAWAVVDRIKRAGGDAHAYLGELDSLDQVRRLADRVRNDHNAIGLLVNNAGIGAGRPPYRKRQITGDGHELRFAVNYLAPVLLARRLIPALAADTPARIVNIASVGQSPVDFSDLRIDHHYTGIEAYFRSKFALVAFTFDLADELADTAITVNCLHPATLMNTGMVRQSMIPPMSTVASGARAVMNLAAEPPGATATGRYFDGHREAKAHKETYDPAIRSRLRTVTNEMLAPYLYD